MDDDWRKMIVEAVRFAVWGAGEGLCPLEGEPADSPEEFLFRFSQATGAGDWDDLPGQVEKLLRADE
jgi:hypothetical protein